MTGFAAGEIQYRNDLSWSTLFRVKKNLIKSRDRRQITVVSNKTVQVCVLRILFLIYLILHVCSVIALHAKVGLVNTFK